MTDGRIKSRRKASEAVVVDYDPLRDIQGGKTEIIISKIGRYLRHNRKTVLLYLLLVVCIVAAFIFYKVYSNLLEERSLVAHEELMKSPLMSPSGGEIDAAILKIEKYEKNFSSKNSSIRADLKKAELFLSADKKQEASDAYLRLAGEVNDQNLEVFFYLKAASILEDTEQYERALQSYVAAEERFPENSSDTYVKALVMFGKGRTLILLGKEKEGKEALKNMMAMKDVDGIDELRILAASFLLHQKK